MNFTNYCLVAIGDTNGILPEIEKISETKPNILNGGGLFITTFKSALTVKEITEWMITNERNFMVFELDKNTSGFNIIKKNVHDGLFGFLKEKDAVEENNITKLLEEIRRKGKAKKENELKVKLRTVNIETEDELTESDIEKMSQKEKQEMINKIIDAGVEKMTEKDKKLLSYLTK
jgi:hypothetical protein